MFKWLWPCLIVIPIVWLSGCSGSGGSVSPGEGRGTITENDFDPFGSAQGPMHLRHFTVPATGTYQLILSSGPGQPSLPNPWIRLLAGHVQRNNQSFFAAYNNGAGVLAENHGASIAQVMLTASEGERFTFVFASKSGGTGAYSWRVLQVQ